MSELVGNWNGSERKAVADASTGEPLPDLAEGELWVRGFGVMQGYYKKEREETFDENAWLHTGGKVFMYENRPFFVGRSYEMIKSQGANVSPPEVELCFEQWPEIEHALVFGLPHPTLEEEVTAVVVFKPGLSMTTEEIQERARRDLHVQGPESHRDRREWGLHSLARLGKTRQTSVADSLTPGYEEGGTDFRGKFTH
jgi:acyl-CoA synthetase (AMP-forming)/AMP-acid ligase II